MLAKNKSGWIVHEYLDVSEGDIGKYKNVTGSYAIIRIKDKYLIGYNNWRDQWEFPAGEMTKIRLWDLNEDIGYVDECDVAIAKTVICK